MKKSGNSKETAPKNEVSSDVGSKKDHILRDFLLAVTVAIIALSGSVWADFNTSKRANEQADRDREAMARKEYLDYARPIIEEAFSVIVKEQSKMCIFEEVFPTASRSGKSKAPNTDATVGFLKLESSNLLGLSEYEVDVPSENSKEVIRVGYKLARPVDVSPVEAQNALNRLQLIDKNGKLVAHYLDAINVKNASSFSSFQISQASAGSDSRSAGRSSLVVDALVNFTNEARRQLGVSDNSSISVSDMDGRNLIVSLKGHERVRCYE